MIIEENEVHYSSNIESFRIFREVFCDNVNETDREKFKNSIIVAEPYAHKVYYDNSQYKFICGIAFYIGKYSSSDHFETRTNCHVEEEITEEQYNQLQGLNYKELLLALLPMFRCQGESEHTWNKPSMPT